MLLRITKGEYMNKTSLYFVLAFGLISSASGQGYNNYYNQNGQSQGRAVQNGNTTNYYDQNGQSQGRAVQNGNTVNFYDQNGQSTGRKTIQ